MLIMPITIRPATLSDVPEILAVEMRADTAAHWTSAQYEKLLDDGVILVAEEAESSRIPLRESGRGRVGDREHRGGRGVPASRHRE